LTLKNEHRQTSNASKHYNSQFISTENSKIKFAMCLVEANLHERFRSQRRRRGIPNEKVRRERKKRPFLREESVYRTKPFLCRKLLLALSLSLFIFALICLLSLSDISNIDCQHSRSSLLLLPVISSVLWSQIWQR